MSRKPHRNRKAELGRVLIVEDDPVLALALEDALHAAGAADVVICPTMDATMAEFERERPDAMVLDVHLADRDDGWALAELADLLGTRRPRIIFSTAAPEEIPESVAEMGAIFEKPYDPAALAAALCGDEQRGLFARLRGAIG